MGARDLSGLQGNKAGLIGASLRPHRRSGGGGFIIGSHHASEPLP